VVRGNLSLLDVIIQSAFIDKPYLADLDGIKFAPAQQTAQILHALPGVIRSSLNRYGVVYNLRGICLILRDHFEFTVRVKGSSSNLPRCSKRSVWKNCSIPTSLGSEQIRLGAQMKNAFAGVFYCLRSGYG
jgi:hypothetical protein